MSEFDALRADVQRFVAERDWLQFHDPKSLLLALTAEVGELCELFQWLPAAEAAHLAQADRLKGAASDEMADILIYLLCLADALNVNLVAAARNKIERNRERFPVTGVAGVAPRRFVP